MANDLNEIMARMSISVDQSVTPPTAGGSEWNLRLKFINRAYNEWNNAYDWAATIKTTFLTITGVSQASISLPADFRKMSGFPLYYSGGVSEGEEFPEIMPNEIKRYSSTDDYYYILGNSQGGYTMIWNPGTMASGASLYIQYYSTPTALASPADMPVLSDIDFLADRATAYVLEVRSDARFQEIETKAREKLLQMLDNENNKSVAYRNRIETESKLYQNFRIGKD